MKKINKYQTNISLSKDKRELSFFYLIIERMRNESEESELVSNFLFLF